VVRQEVWRDDQQLFVAVVTLVCLTQGGRATRLPEAMRAALDRVPG